LYALPTAIRVIKSSRERWARHMACMGGEEIHRDYNGETWKKETTRKTWP